MNSQSSTVFTSVGWVMAVALLLATSGCGRSRRIEVIDLDRVLTVLDTAMKAPIGAAGAGVAKPEAGKPGEGEAGEGEPAEGEPAEGETVEVDRIDSSDERAELTGEFLTKFSTALNEAKLMSHPIGVLFEQRGSMLGFSDFNGDQRKGGGDRELFRIEVDTDGNRIIASDLQRPQYRRDHYYGSSYYGHRYHSGGGGFFMGYMLGSMSGRSHRYYGSSGRSRPSYGTMNMASPGYQRTAVTVAKTKAKAKARAASAARSRSSARSRGGSSSFRSGK